MECHAVHSSIGHAEAWEEDGSEACAVDAVNSIVGLFGYRCGGQDHIAAKPATPVPAKGKGKNGGKGAVNKEKGKGEWSGFCSEIGCVDKKRCTGQGSRFLTGSRR